MARASRSCHYHQARSGAPFQPLEQEQDLVLKSHFCLWGLYAVMHNVLELGEEGELKAQMLNKPQMLIEVQMLNLALLPLFRQTLVSRSPIFRCRYFFCFSLIIFLLFHYWLLPINLWFCLLAVEPVV